MGTAKERGEQNEGDAATTHTTTATRAAAATKGASTAITTTATTTNAAKKIRRAFSMPRNPFRWSRKFKTAAAVTSSSSSGVENGSGKDNGKGERRGSHTAISSCVGGGRGRSGSIVSLSSYEAPVSTTNNSNMANNNNNNTTASNGNSSSNNNNNNKRARALRRSSFRKFLNRIAQHLSSSVNVSEEHHSAASRIAFIEIVPFYTGCWRRKEANKHGHPAGPGSAAGGGAGPGGGSECPPSAATSGRRTRRRA
ncbi:probable serine/threonine-protein kinase DDB_G0276181 isoform X1 [Drosophila ficusphila]|uniref:probable serine/threonine-protein kinase DDB_G0276181 isoform X1 n=1 Tax=Drosophila ficusphila TaxID=30025 RepID=UPI001C895193|nr:probable serine/threonine-protein kinase DDB_G0276181 isoform X1 [Drosophila ficusphila]